MKKQLIIIALLSCLSLPAMADREGYEIVDNRNAAFNFVVGAGLNLSSFNGDVGGVSFSNKSGASFGLGLETRLVQRNEHTPIEDGLLGIYAGLALESTGTKDSNGKGITMYNLGLPVLARFYLVPALYLEAGPEFFMNLSMSPNSYSVGTMDLDLSNHKANDVKVLVGTGIHLGNLGVGVRYMLGMSDFAHNVPWKCNVLQLNLSYSIGTGW